MSEPRTIDLGVLFETPGSRRLGQLYDRDQRHRRRERATMSATFFTFKAEVVRVVDADTLDLRFDLGFKIQRVERIRLADVNAWETRGSEKVQGLAAKARVEELCPVGSTVVVETRKAGKYNRYIGRISLTDGTDLGGLLLAEGHARPYGQ